MNPSGTSKSARTQMIQNEQLQDKTLSLSTDHSVSPVDAIISVFVFSAILVFLVMIFSCFSLLVSIRHFMRTFCLSECSTESLILKAFKVGYPCRSQIMWTLV